MTIDSFKIQLGIEENVGILEFLYINPLYNLSWNKKEIFWNHGIHGILVLEVALLNINSS